MSETKYDPLRRCRLDLLTPAERAICDAAQAVEAAGCDRRLTDAVVLLWRARDRVADFVDGVDDRATDPAPEPAPDSNPTLTETPASKSQQMRAVRP